jgi:hypothetical protein
MELQIVSLFGPANAGHSLHSRVAYQRNKDPVFTLLRGRPHLSAVMTFTIEIKPISAATATTANC